MNFASLRRTPPFDRLLFLLSRWTPEFERVLFLESGSRAAAARFLEEFYREEQPGRVDVLTCYEKPPLTFDAARGEAFFTHQAQTSETRRQLFARFQEADYTAVCILCTGDDIMTRWKWMAALRVPAKVLIVNESADTFWLDRGHWRYLARMADERSGLSELALLRLLGQTLVFPFTFLFLLCFAAGVHLRKFLRGL